MRAGVASSSAASPAGSYAEPRLAPRSGAMTTESPESSGRPSATPASPSALRTSSSIFFLSIMRGSSEEARVPGARGQLAVLHQADLLQPALELRRRSHAEELAQGRVVLERRRLIVQHHVVAHGQALEEVAAGRGQEDLQVLQVVLV